MNYYKVYKYCILISKPDSLFIAVCRLSTSTHLTMANKEDAPKVLLISLNLESFFDKMYSSLLTSLRSKANLLRVEEAAKAIRLMSESPPPSAVLVTDEGLTFKANSNV